MAKKYKISRSELDSMKKKYGMTVNPTESS